MLKQQGGWDTDPPCSNATYSWPSLSKDPLFLQFHRSLVSNNFSKYYSIYHWGGGGQNWCIIGPKQFNLMLFKGSTIRTKVNSKLCVWMVTGLLNSWKHGYCLLSFQGFKCFSNCRRYLLIWNKTQEGEKNRNWVGFPLTNLVI